MLLNVNPSTLHENPDAVYVATGEVTQGALHADDAISGIAVSAAATPKSDRTLSIVRSSSWLDRDRSAPAVTSLCSYFPLEHEVHIGRTQLSNSYFLDKTGTFWTRRN